MREIDLHVHTTASDGTCTPAEVAELAHKIGLKAIAITDHDTESGYFEAAEAGEKLGIEVVPGIEISTKYGVAVHILGYFIDPAVARAAPGAGLGDKRPQRQEPQDGGAHGGGRPAL